MFDARSRRRFKLRRRLHVSFWSSIACAVIAVAVLGQLSSNEEHWGLRRSGSCGGDGGSVYPDDAILTKPYGDDPNRWAVILHIIGIVYMLIGLNTVCDVCFSGALEIMVEEWEVQPDVAGATFMAAGGSAPELFTSLIGVFAETDVGFGTIVGSAVFNVLFVIGLCGYFATTAIDLSWWPLFRDCLYYLLGLGVLAGFASDEKIELWEAIVLFVLYIVYLLIMWQNTRLESWVKGTPAGGEETGPSGEEGQTHDEIKLPAIKLNQVAPEEGDDGKPEGDTVEPGALVDVEAAGAEEGAAEGEEEESLMDIPEGTYDKVVWYLCSPIYVMLHYGTMEPSIEKVCGVSKMVITFVQSLGWIAVFSYLLVWWVEVLGEVMHVDTIIMGFTLLAAGTSIPDAVSSVHFALLGEGDMAVSSSIGSNIFDILVGLPFPWMLKVGIVDPIANGAVSTITLCSPYLAFHVMLLFFMVLAVVLIIHLLGWKLNKTLGICMAVLYVVFLVVALTVEFTKPSALKM